jgi:hypothetical protein
MAFQQAPHNPGAKGTLFPARSDNGYALRPKNVIQIFAHLTGKDSKVLI